MNKETILNALKEIKEKSKKRKFNQTIDLIVNLKNINLKDTEEQVDFFVTLHNDIGKKMKVCALVGPELKDQAQKACDETVVSVDFPKYSDKKLVKTLATNNNFFVAQANLMPKIAQIFGRVLGPRNKMPNPKAGCIVPPNANLSVLMEKLQKTIRINIKSNPSFKCAIGTEEGDIEKIADNILEIYNQLILHLPKETANIKSIMIKLTMGKPVKIA